MGGYFFVGLLGLLVLLAGLVTSMALAARGAARVLSVPGFRWFSLTAAPSSWWRVLLVWLAAALAPWLVSASLFLLDQLLNGETVTTTRVEVREGAARQAGVKDGDRILTIAGERVETWDQLRQIVQRQTGPAEFEIARGSGKLTVSITPSAGKIGVAPITERQTVSPLRAAAHAVTLPTTVVHASVRSWAHTLAGSEHAELKGPVGIVRDTGEAQRGSAVLAFLGMLGAYFWPFLVGAALFDAVSSAIFVATHPSASTWSPRAQRLARVQQSALLALAGSVLSVVSVVLGALGATPAAWGALLGAALFTAYYPLLWIAGTEVWRRRSVWIVLLAGLLIPCVTPIALFDLVQTLRRELRHEGFRTRWWRAEPSSA